MLKEYNNSQKGEIVSIESLEWSISDGILYFYFGEEKNIKIPEGTRKVSSTVFYKKELNSVVFPESLTIINDRAFANNHLTKVEFPSSLSYIGRDAFLNNELIELIFNQNIVVFGDAFCGNPIHIIRLTKNARYIDWKDDEYLDTVRILEIASYKEHIVFYNLCPNIEVLYIDNLPGISLRHFLKKCCLRKKKNLRHVHIKNEVSSLEKLAIQVLYPKITFLYGDFSNLLEKPTEKNATPKKNIDTEIQERIDKIYEISSLLDEKERSAIENNIALLFRDYKKNLENLKPKFNTHHENSITLNPIDARTLRTALLGNLDTIIFNLSCSDNLKKLLKDIKQYKELMHTQLETAPTEAVSIKDQIRFIIYVYQKLTNVSLENQLKDILNDCGNKISKKIMQMLEEKSRLSLELDVTTNFEKRIQNLYDKAKNYQIKVETYQELLDSLELKKDTDLAKDIKTALEIINLFYISDKNRFNEELQTIITNYKNKIKEILFTENTENKESSSEIELEVRKDLQPLLSEIYHLSPKAVCYNKLKEELETSMEYIYREDIKITNGAILDCLKEIKVLLENEYIDEEGKREIQNVVETCLNRWYQELYTNEYEILKTLSPNENQEEISANIRFELLVLKELLTIKMNLEDYIKKSVDYQKISDGIISVEENNPFVLKNKVKF